VESLQQNSGVADFSYAQGFATGTLMTFELDNDRITSNSLFGILSPEVDTRFRFSTQQP
jgi:hypothetical protein